MIARSNAAQLLTDDQMKQFVVNGFLPLNANVSRSLNQKIFKQLSDAVPARGLLGNNTMPQVPELQEVFDSPVVRGAVSSVLGPSYILHQHRHTHFNPPGARAGGWHKDSYWGYQRKFRDHRLWWAMIMYYPQDTPIEVGPTKVLPGTQNWNSLQADHEKNQAHLVGEAGTFALIHFDLWHASSQNISEQFRHMCKFQFVRMDAPTAPTWDCRNPDWVDPSRNVPPYSQRAMWRDAWDWYAGRAPGSSLNSLRRSELPPSPGSLLDQLKSGSDADRVLASDELGVAAVADADAVAALIIALADPFEPVSLNATYALAAIGAPAVPALKEVLFNGSEPLKRQAIYALGAMGLPGVDTLLEAAESTDELIRFGACYGLGMTTRTRNDVIDALIQGAADPSPHVRYTAIDSLGQFGEPAARSVPVLIERLGDPEPETRFNASLALARIGKNASDAIPALEALFLDSNRYVRGYAIEALHRIGTPQALEAIIHQLKYQRWCPITAMDNTFYP